MPGNTLDLDHDGLAISTGDKNINALLISKCERRSYAKAMKA